MYCVVGVDLKLVAYNVKIASLVRLCLVFSVLLRSANIKAQRSLQNMNLVNIYSSK